MSMSRGNSIGNWIFNHPVFNTYLFLRITAAEQFSSCCIVKKPNRHTDEYIINSCCIKKNTCAEENKQIAVPPGQ